MAIHYFEWDASNTGERTASAYSAYQLILLDANSLEGGDDFSQHRAIPKTQ